MKTKLMLILIAACIASTPFAFGLAIETVLVGNLGNPNDTIAEETGSVDYLYRIGKTEITNAQYVEFLNAVALGDPHGLYTEAPLWDEYHGFVRLGEPGSYTYAVKPDAIGEGISGTNYTYGDKPVVTIDWYDAARFCNWLHNGQPTGPQDAATTEDGAYTFSDTRVVSARRPQAKWFIPNDAEWYKAAYYDGAQGAYYRYPTHSNEVPNNNLPSADTGNSANYNAGTGPSTGSQLYGLTSVGSYTLSRSYYGTFDQGGNVMEWIEQVVPGSSDRRFLRGGSFTEPAYKMSVFPENDFAHNEFFSYGFRVAAAVPEPSSAMLLCGALGVAAVRRWPRIRNWGHTRGRESFRLRFHASVPIRDICGKTLATLAVPSLRTRKQVAKNSA
jgi:formylglycine-generating enzyme required for sulfatase activity